jgi:MEDS: MEthanogen/methylotroph, DcmR Sensory domain
MSWENFIHSARAGEHAVQVYLDTRELVSSVAAYLEAGFDSGAPGVVIATAEHRALIDRELGAPAGLMTMLDAEETLASIIDGASISPERFANVVGSTIDRAAAAHPGTTVHAFGEMVDILWHRGQEEAALALEELWNDLAHTSPFSLLCGYSLDLFDADVQGRALPEIFCRHSHARPAADPGRLAAAVHDALAEILGTLDATRIYLDFAEEVPPSGVPRAQCVLMWLTAKDKQLAQRVLERVRARYASPPRAAVRVAAS